MEALFTAIPKNGKLWFSNVEDLFKYCVENEGIELAINVKHLAKLPEKLRMFSFLFGPLMDTAVRGYTRQGWEGIDKVKARYMLQAEYAKEDVFNPKTGEVKTTLIDLKSMSKARLHKFISDCIFHLETHLEVEPPDAEAFKIKKLTGRDFKSVK